MYAYVANRAGQQSEYYDTAEWDDKEKEFKNSTDLNPVLFATNLINKTHEKEIEEPDPKKYEPNAMENSPKELTDEEIEKLLEEITSKSSQ